MMLEFKVNELISLKLEDSKTYIYFNGKLFRQCKSVILNIPKDEIEGLSSIKSIDEAVEKLHKTPAGRNSPNVMGTILPPETEFWGHCSNLQAWVEHNYDTNILNYRLSFPLLKELASLGDSVAKKQFKSEIFKRFESGHMRVIFFLLIESYLTFFNEEEKSVLWELIFKKLSISLEKICQKGEFQSVITFLTLEQIIRWYKQQSKKAKEMLKGSVKTIFEKGHQKSIQTLIDDDYFRNYFESHELLSMFLESNSPITQKILHLFDKAVQFKEIFDEKISKYTYIDQKRKRLTGEHWYAANNYILEIISLTMEPGYHSLFAKFGEKPIKNLREWLSYLT